MTTTIEILKALFIRDLNKLKLEIETYKDESKIWVIEKSILNSAGNLCLHINGNLNTYIGAQIGNTGYIRNRDLEFSNKNVPRDILLNQIDATILMINKTLESINGFRFERRTFLFGF